ncbi:MAG: hypothetical protein H6975_06685 [Gammaproteobacteria bacterium]|nr:hypothetical protein [Gammaproteobacteria bacterium]
MKSLTSLELANYLLSVDLGEARQVFQHLSEVVSRFYAQASLAYRQQDHSILDNLGVYLWPSIFYAVDK